MTTWLFTAPDTWTQAQPPPLALPACPQCGAWQWQFGLVDIQCTSCGYRYRPTAAEMPHDDQGQRGCAALGYPKGESSEAKQYETTLW